MKKELSCTIGPDESKKILDIGDVKPMSDIYFLKLELKDETGKLISSNFYWLSSKGDEMADFTSLDKLAIPQVKMTYSTLKGTENRSAYVVEIKNTGKTLAFGLNLKVLRSGSKELVLPVFIDDNYFALLPSEKKKIRIEYNPENLAGEKAVIALDGWNAKLSEKALE